MGNQLELFSGDDSNKVHPFKKRKVVVKGFSYSQRKSIREYVVNHGGIIADTISKNTHYIIMSEDDHQPSIEKIQKLWDDGYAIRLLRQHDFDEIRNGNYDAYMTEKVIPKILNMNYDLLIRHQLPYGDKINPYSGREIYICDGIAGDKSMLEQMLGNLAAWSCSHIEDDDINTFLLSDKTVENLKNGIKDDTIQAIERLYNKSKSIIFEYLFIIEGDVLNFVKNWCDKFNDETTRYYYNLYFES